MRQAFSTMVHARPVGVDEKLHMDGQIRKEVELVTKTKLLWVFLGVHDDFFDRPFTPSRRRRASNCRRAVGTRVVSFRFDVSPPAQAL